MALVKAVTVVADLHGVTPGEGEEGGGGEIWAIAGWYATQCGGADCSVQGLIHVVPTLG